MILEVVGREVAWSWKVKEHYRKLARLIRIHGLWQWRGAALALHRAGIKMHSGRIPVGRMWSMLAQMMPPVVRAVSLR